MAAAENWLRQIADGVEIRVRLTPRASKDGIDGPRTDAGGEARLSVRVRAIPEDGKANAALIALIAKSAGIAKSHVEIVTGHGARLKTVRIACNPEKVQEIQSRLAASNAKAG